MTRATGVISNGVTIQVQRDSRGVDCKTPNCTGNIIRQIVRAWSRQISACGKFCAGGSGGGACGRCCLGKNQKYAEQ